MFNWIYQIFNGTGNINMPENMLGNETVQGNAIFITFRIERKIN
jgi:hypothetical protein